MSLRRAVTAAVLTCVLATCACSSSHAASTHLAAPSFGLASAVVVNARPWLDAHKRSTVRTCLESRCMNLRAHPRRVANSFRLSPTANNGRDFRLRVRLDTPTAAARMRTVRLYARPSTRLSRCGDPVKFVDIVLIYADGRVAVEYSPQNCVSPQ
jgi:hypothetical protein